jgi:nicotinamide mononucleotide (NMN) deamidase PncC
LSHRRGEPKRTAALLQDPVALTDELAWAVRQQAGSDLGLALHAIPDADSTIQNLARGQTYVSLTDGNRFLQRSSMMAGRGQYDRTRMTLNAIDLLRTGLLEGMS